MADSSVISQSTVVRGNVQGNGSLEILGRIEGNVAVTGDVTLGEGSRVDGSISGAQISVGGIVVGDVTGTEAVLVEGTGRVAGDLLAPRIGIAEGGLVRGHVRTSDMPAPAPKPVAKPAAAAAPARPAVVARPAAAAPPARPAPQRPAAPAPVKTESKVEAPVARPVKEAPAKEASAKEAPAKEAPIAKELSGGKDRVAAEPPPPVAPAVAKGVKAKNKKKSAGKG